MKPEGQHPRFRQVLVIAGMLAVTFLWGGLAGCGQESAQSPNEKTAAPARAPGQNIEQEKRSKNTS